MIDIGGGDLQRTDISVNPYRMAGHHLGAGTIGIARTLAAAFPQFSLNNVRAQQALVSRTAGIAGRRQAIACHRQQWIVESGAVS